MNRFFVRVNITIQMKFATNFRGRIYDVGVKDLRKSSLLSKVGYVNIKANFER